MAFRAETGNVNQQQATWEHIKRRFDPNANGDHDHFPPEGVPEVVFRQARKLDDILHERHERMSTPLRQQEDLFPGRRRIMQYDGALDFSLYEQAYAIQDPLERVQRISQLDSFIYTQLATHLGERLEVLLSISTYTIDADNELYVTSLGKKASKMIADGIAYQTKASDMNPVDLARMHAEVSEMESVQKILCDTSVPIGTMVVVISPPGGRDEVSKKDSLFLHNFVDVFRVEEQEINGNTERVVKVYRYASNLTYEENLGRLTQLKRDYFAHAKPDEPLDAYMLRNVTTVFATEESQNAHTVRFSDTAAELIFETPEDVHQFFSHSNTFMATEDFQEVIVPGCRDLIQRYIQVLHMQADGLTAQESANLRDKKRRLQAAMFNSILIQADSLEEQLRDLQGHTFDVHTYRRLRQNIVKSSVFRTANFSDAEILQMGRKENVKQKGGGCPGESGMDTGSNAHSIYESSEARISVSNAIFSTAELGTTNTITSDEKGDLFYRCANGHLNVRKPHETDDHCLYDWCTGVVAC